MDELELKLQELRLLIKNIKKNGDIKLLNQCSEQIDEYIREIFKLIIDGDSS